MKKKLLILSSILMILLVWSAGCSLKPDQSETPTPPPVLTTAPADIPPTATAITEPTPTEVVELAAVVNEEGIRKSSYEASLLQLQAALINYPDMLPAGQTPQDAVIDQLVDRTLLAQAARAAGFVLTEEMVDQRLAEITDNLGGQDALNAWLAENGYTEKDFRYELHLEIEAAWQRNQITSAVPETAEQVRAQQILFYDPYQASRAYDQLQAGFPFEQIAANNDPQKLGYLDWFPRGFLLFPELEDVAFSLQPGQYSSVIETDVGYHILYVFETDPARPLTAEARLILQEKALADWLAQQRSQSQIEVLITP